MMCLRFNSYFQELSFFVLTSLNGERSQNVRAVLVANYLSNF